MMILKVALNTNVHKSVFKSESFFVFRVGPSVRSMIVVSSYSSLENDRI